MIINKKWNASSTGKHTFEKDGNPNNFSFFRKFREEEGDKVRAGTFFLLG